MGALLFHKFMILFTFLAFRPVFAVRMFVIAVGWFECEILGGKELLYLVQRIERFQVESFD